MSSALLPWKGLESPFQPITVPPGAASLRDGKWFERRRIGLRRRRVYLGPALYRAAGLFFHQWLLLREFQSSLLRSLDKFGSNLRRGLRDVSVQVFSGDGITSRHSCGAEHERRA